MNIGWNWAKSQLERKKTSSLSVTVLSLTKDKIEEGKIKPRKNQLTPNKKQPPWTDISLCLVKRHQRRCKEDKPFQILKETKYIYGQEQRNPNSSASEKL